MGLVLGLILGAAAPARAAKTAATSLSVGADPRVELLGVIRRLAGDKSAASAASDFPAADVDAWFGSFKDDPAVKAYRRDQDGDGRTYGLLFLFLSDPPELKWKRPVAELPADMVARAGGQEALDEFLALLRAFSKKSRFPEFYARHRADYARLVAALGAPRKDLVAELEAYVGPLRGRMHIVVSPLFGEGGPSYIVPYPYAGPGVKVGGPFDVYAVRRIGDLLEPGSSYPLNSVWRELLCVATDGGLSVYGEQIARYSALRPAPGGECDGTWVPSCAGYLIGTAVFSRLRARNEALARDWPGRDPGPIGLALAERLKEYEADRKRYPTLLDFYPRLVAVFAEFDARRAAGSKP